ncbi:MAG: 2-amino-4-hydroxy-6-hydroxymethyldihydropteridine diphosphokinase [Acidobacteriia bacterium]|nr:2-amino-4-hydroxy-6-hydroxymethyldihydropteridine diphosphokinase [Terriglobia bacterium]
MEPSEIHTAYLGLGSNVEDKRENLRLARVWLRTPKVKIIRESSIYKTSPVDYLEQDWFFNQVLAIETLLSPAELLAHCLSVEYKIGRERTFDKGPRTIDVDLLFYESEVINRFDLVIPHPCIAERKFVLTPMAELAPDFIHPLLKKSIRTLLAERVNDPATVELL